MKEAFNQETHITHGTNYISIYWMWWAIVNHTLIEKALMDIHMLQF